ncbi:hypothetical protein EQ826_12545 [Ectopseudomonas mendocina]|nr:hypothetical protein [Pseudomonas mendocina]TRO25847.1 hypothetical protein EQ828_02870 [Pseudomonas mendocina]TRO25984.1 hypothetical protein EQ826_12545 [Pseudomonas mendocina]
MTNNEILAFLVPGSDPLQVSFFFLIFVLCAITLVMMLWGARQATWEKKWNGSGADDLDVEHGSVNEISAAVASSGEKMADIMPGILLIFGLLGTFLGLGIALNKASTILLEASSGGGIDSSMVSLMGMMEGLGTKFKTSTWGLIAFLTLKGFAGLSSYDERRLRWCIGKMKVAFDQGREAMRAIHERDQSTLISALSKIDQTLLEQLQASRRVLEQHVQLSQQGTQATNNALTGMRQAVADLQQSLVPQLHTLNSSALNSQRALDEHTALLQQHSEQNRQQLEDSQATRSNLESFISTNSENLSAISAAANQMASAAGGIGQSADQLKAAISEFRSSVGDVLDGLKHDLAGTIDNMGESFTRNMSNISETMAQATAGISGAVENLSENVGKTMSSVQQSNETSIEIQKKAQGEFLVTSGSLIENVEAMTTLVNDLRENILSGLRAVSENGRRMVSLDKRYSDVVEKAARSADALEQFSEHLKSIQLSSPLQPAVEMMIQQIETFSSNLGNIDRHILALKQRLDSSDHSEHIGHIRNAMGEVIGHLEGIDSQLKKTSLESTDA